MIYIIDYGAGNLLSAYHAFEEVYPDTRIIKKVSEIEKTPSALVLPGDGSFPFAYKNLVSLGWKDYLLSEREIPLMGICVGFQLLFSGSDEDGGSEGLGIIPGHIRRFPGNGFKVPHMGWNTAVLSRDETLFAGLPDEEYFYFVHSFYPEPESDDYTIMTTEYEKSFPSGVRRGNTVGFQFHPEKSHASGRRIIAAFVKAATGKGKD